MSACRPRSRRGRRYERRRDRLDIEVLGIPINLEDVLAGGKTHPALSHPLKARQRSGLGDVDDAGDVNPVHFKMEATDAGHAADGRVEAVRSCLRYIDRVLEPFAGCEVGDCVARENLDDVDALTGPIGSAIARRVFVIPDSFAALIEILSFEKTRY